MSVPRRIAVVTNASTHYRRPLFERLAGRFEVDFYLTSRGREWYRAPSVGAATGQFHAVSETRALPLARALIRGAYDCIVVNLAGRSTLLAAVVAARVTRTPLVLWVGIWQHPTTPFHRLSRPLARQLYRGADALIVYGPHVASYLADESGRTEGVFEAPQSVDNEFFCRPVDAVVIRKLREEFGADDAPIGCFVGRLVGEKGLETLLQALALTGTRQKLLLVGSGKLEAHLRGVAASLGIESRIIFAGHVAQASLPDYLQVADFLVLPSITTPRFKEPWGLVVNEAMNSRLPVVATNAVGAAAGGLVVDAETGYVVPEGDPRALASAMDELARDEALRLHLGANGAKRVSRWNFDAATDGFEQAIVAAIDERARKDAGFLAPEASGR